MSINIMSRIKTITNEKRKNKKQDGIITKKDYWYCDKEFTVIEVEKPTKYTPNGVITLQADGVNFRVDTNCLKEIKD